MTTSPAPPHSLRAALVGRVHGVHGEVRVEALGGDSTRFTRGMRLVTEPGDRVLVVRSSRPGTEGSVLLAFEGIDTPDEASVLRGVYLTVPVDAARRLGEGEWFVWRLVGLRCVTPDGELLGEVADVEPAPAADVIVIHDAAGRALRYPMVREFVREVDVEHGVITLVPQAEVSA